MQAFLVLILCPVVCGVIAFASLRSASRASFAVVVGVPLLIFAALRVIVPREPWSAFAVFLVSPLVIALAVVTVFVLAGRRESRARRHAWVRRAH